MFKVRILNITGRTQKTEITVFTRKVQALIMK